MQRMQQDPLGEALLDYYCHPSENKKIIVRSPDFDDDVIPVHHFFRTFKEMPQLEQIALNMCSGMILDVGAGAGCHSLVLQSRGLNVTALEVSPGATEVLRKRGVNNCFQQNIYHHKGIKYDTIVLLMNGIGIAGTPEGAIALLNHLHSLLLPDGKILVDSSDLIYLYDSEFHLPEKDKVLNDSYYGIVEYQMQYKNAAGKPFQWLYLDEQSFFRIAQITGFELKIIEKNRHFGFLAKLTIKQ